ncbi:MAG: hypothetical protein ABSE48_13855 [Verrucomicrobiota bacterium]|jgi:hypothetical protein
MDLRTNYHGKAWRGQSSPLWTLILLAWTLAVTDAIADQWSSSYFSSLAPALFYNWDDSSLPSIPGLTFTSYPNDYGGEAPINFIEAGLAPLALENVSGPAGYSVPQISFNPPVQAVGGYPFPLDSGKNTITETVYDQNSNVLDSASVTVYEYGSPVFLGLGETTTNIYRVQWQYSTAGFIGVANIIYQPGPSIVLGNTVSSSTNIAFQFQSLGGHTNTIQFSTDLASGSWTTLSNLTSLGNGAMQKITVPTTNAPAGYFRVQAY